MSEENVDLLHRAIDAMNRRDIDAFLELTDPNVEFTSRIAALEGGGPGHGHDGIRRWWENLLEVFPELAVEVEEVKDLGDATVTRVRQHSQGLEHDAPADQTQWIVTQWRDGKAIWWSVFLTEAEALKAAGLRE